MALRPSCGRWFVPLYIRDGASLSIFLFQARQMRLLLLHQQILQDVRSADA